MSNFQTIVNVAEHLGSVDLVFIEQDYKRDRYGNTYGYYKVYTVDENRKIIEVTREVVLAYPMSKLNKRGQIKIYRANPMDVARRYGEAIEGFIGKPVNVSIMY